MEKSLVEGGNNRRSFLRTLITGTAATLSFPAFAAERMEEETFPLMIPQGSADEKYWLQVKRQFAVPDRLIMLNAANLCPAPYAITQSVQAGLSDLGKDVSFQFRSQFSKTRRVSLEKLATYLGVSNVEVGITRNTSESNNIIVNGFDFKPGDEVIIWDQNHPSNNVAWEQRAKRMGFTVKKISVPAAPQSPGDLLQPFEKAITPKTRLIAFSHISNVSGIAIPAGELCSLARAKQILTLVDGAQSFGMIDLNLREMGCDFYSGSTHKWLMGPLENGVLYVRKESMSRLWPTMISAGWKETSTTVDELLCVLGQRNETTPAALPETLDFHFTIGKKNIEDRVRMLNDRLKNQIKEKLPQAVFVSPLPASMSAGITVFNIPGRPSQEIFQKLYEVHGMACASTAGIRLSPHIYNTLEDMDRVVEAVRGLSS